MRPVSWVATILIGVACAAPPITTAPPSGPDAACAMQGLAVARTLDPDARLSATLASTVADVASWQSTGYGTGARVEGPPPVAGRPLERVAVCYFDGRFDIGGHPANAPYVVWDQLLVFVDAAGKANFVTAGRRDAAPLGTPPHGP